MNGRITIKRTLAGGGRVFALGACLLGFGFVMACSGDDGAESTDPFIEPNPSPNGPEQHVPDETPPVNLVTPADVAPGLQCIPDCEGKQCGPDGCGGACGWCPSSDSCQAGLCVKTVDCTPVCAGLMVGADDGCGGVCSSNGMVVGLKAGGAQDVGTFRALLAAGEVPDPASFPIEGWLNEHGTPLPAPETDRRVTLHAFLGASVAAAGEEPLVALQLGMNSALSPETLDESRFNLAVVIDTSGSMAQGGKLDLVKSGLVAMLDALDADDRLTIVTYANTATVLVDAVPVTDRNALAQQIGAIQASGGTNLWEGLELGYQHAAAGAGDGRHTHVMLLTDGLASVGIDDPETIIEKSRAFNETGLTLTTIGVGTKLDFPTLHTLASQSGGSFYHLTEGEQLGAVFTDELVWLLTPIADDLEVTFELPAGASVEAVYGFEFEVTDNIVRLLGPSPQTASSTTTGGSDGPAGEPTAPSTLTAAHEAGLVIAKFSGLDLAAHPTDEPVTTVRYQYRWVATGETEQFEVPVMRGEPSAIGGGAAFFTNTLVQRGFCLLRSGLAIVDLLSAAEAGETYPLLTALDALESAQGFCAAVAGPEAGPGQVDPMIESDLELMDRLREVVCNHRSCPEVQ